MKCFLWRICHLILDYMFTLLFVQVWYQVLWKINWQSHPISQALKWQKYGQSEFVMDGNQTSTTFAQFVLKNFKSTLEKKLHVCLFFVDVLLTWLICYGSFSTYVQVIYIMNESWLLKSKNFQQKCIWACLKVVFRFSSCLVKYLLYNCHSLACSFIQFIIFSKRPHVFEPPCLISYYTSNSILKKWFLWHFLLWINYRIF